MSINRSSAPEVEKCWVFMISVLRASGKRFEGRKTGDVIKYDLHGGVRNGVT